MAPLQVPRCTPVATPEPAMKPGGIPSAPDSRILVYEILPVPVRAKYEFDYLGRETGFGFIDLYFVVFVSLPFTVIPGTQNPPPRVMGKHPLTVDAKATIVAHESTGSLSAENLPRPSLALG